MTCPTARQLIVSLLAENDRLERELAYFRAEYYALSLEGSLRRAQIRGDEEAAARLQEQYDEAERMRVPNPLAEPIWT
ncbi:MAG: hypothetical protein KDF64_02895 [Geminicoccaceae bacterium]|nr:hypothetical protein [Geminicoccaceae bacterium]